MAKKLTPMMKQYYEIKAEYEDCILFFRLGDFYEMFGEDAKDAAAILDITLTSRSKGADALPMCGIPYHSSESYIAKLNQKGKKVALCEQVSDPKAKGIVERKVVKVVTPSTNVSEMSLEAKENQFLVSVAGKIGNLGICITDVSTGEMMFKSVQDLDGVEKAIFVNGAREIVVERSLYSDPDMYSFLSGIDDLLVSSFKLAGDRKRLLGDHFGESIFETAGLDSEAEIDACSLALSYLKEVVSSDLGNFKRIKKAEGEEFFELDRSTIVNLEIFQTMIDGSRENSLLGVIDKTMTAGGGRMLRRWILRPLKNIAGIETRLDFVNEFYEDAEMTAKLRELLKGCYDMERLFSRISLGVANPRDMVNIYNTLRLVREIKGSFGNGNGKIAELCAGLDECEELVEVLQRLRLEEAKVSVKDAGIFEDGVDAKIDEYRELLFNGKEYLLKLQQREIEETGISNLKLGFNKVFGYYLEVSKGKVDLVPDRYIRKQTLTNNERYITPELKEYEEKVLSADELLKNREFELFIQLLEEISSYGERIMKLAEQLAFLDVTSSFAYLAREKRFCAPELSNEKEINLVEAKHPVIEDLLPRGKFISNDLVLTEDSFIRTITGPNMGGKSTFLRQNAICVLLGQIGSYVPAKRAQIGIVDQIFSRVGASDNLSKGQSTFMVEMSETAYILNQATENSLIIMDEIGRGTSTIDGLSLATAIIDHLSLDLKARVLFATHYHELIDHSEGIGVVENLSVSVIQDDNGKPVFLHKIKPGGISKSYGIDVAEIAGLPGAVIEKSKHYMKELELIELSSGTNRSTGRKVGVSRIDEENQLGLFVASQEDPALKEFVDRFKNIDINKMTPLEAIQKLSDLISESKDIS